MNKSLVLLTILLASCSGPTDLEREAYAIGKAQNYFRGNEPDFFPKMEIRCDDATPQDKSDFWSCSGIFGTGTENSIVIFCPTESKEGDECSPPAVEKGTTVDAWPL